jgi:hypothetical protein
MGICVGSAERNRLLAGYCPLFKQAVYPDLTEAKHFRGSLQMLKNSDDFLFSYNVHLLLISACTSGG